MANRVLFATLAVLLFVAISNYGVHCGEEDEDDAGPSCPDVGDLQCSQTQPAPAGCRKTATITLEDGTECTGCQVCIEDGVVSLNREFGRMCPPIVCPALVPPKTCNATYYDQKVNLMDTDCDLCKTYACA